MTPAEATEVARRIEASLFAIRQGMRDLMEGVEIVLRAMAAPVDPDMGFPISPPSPLPTPAATPARAYPLSPRWTDERRQLLDHMTADGCVRDAIHAALNELDGPEVTKAHLAAFLQGKRRWAPSPEPACEISPEAPEPAVTAEPAPGEISPAPPRPSALNIYAGMAERQAVDAARCPMTWEGVVEWGKGNSVPLQGHARQFLSAVNAKRAEFGLPAFQLVKPRGPHEVMKPLVIRDKDVRA